MPDFRANYFFTQFSRGWTETWYFTSTDLPSATSSATTVAAPLAACRSEDTVLTGLRVVQVNPSLPRVTLTRALNFPGLSPHVTATGVPSEFADVVTSAAMMSCKFQDGTKKTIMLRGLEDTDLARDFIGNPKPSPRLFGALQTLGLVLFNSGAEIRHYLRPGTSYAIASVSPNVTVTSRTDLNSSVVVPAIPDGTAIRVTGVPLKDLPWLKGIWVPIKFAANGFTLAYPVPSGTLVLTPNMKVWILEYAYSPLASGATPGGSFELSDFRTRKTGRPTSVPRGRARGIRFRR